MNIFYPNMSGGFTGCITDYRNALICSYNYMLCRYGNSRDTFCSNHGECVCGECQCSQPPPDLIPTNVSEVVQITGVHVHVQNIKFVMLIKSFCDTCAVAFL